MLPPNSSAAAARCLLDRHHVFTFAPVTPQGTPAAGHDNTARWVSRGAIRPSSVVAQFDGTMPPGQSGVHAASDPWHRSWSCQATAHAYAGSSWGHSVVRGMGWTLLTRGGG